jgi:hypothetical protein
MKCRTWLGLALLAGLFVAMGCSPPPEKTVTSESVKNRLKMPKGAK